MEADRSEYDSAIDGNYSTHLALFGRSFIARAFMAPIGPKFASASSGTLESNLDV
ncbi:hypothetical protein M2202_004867 [Bradyrhizobium japonicum]|jgi:hypothetical protein|uniref:hypothetical protein n=1 Tax=Bradyrhizobium japonicum TaxID=375 RepID=UPI00209EBD5A|nr:hypothetical protein [Bradyrhizobium japonicum]MCP1766321.1 hypothetical protein [Bradyrhizobium japonicum]MCP1788459.1 hypothetical protein [Bradyrhizobium japonicum]MCP1810334.1 hypothetical protein [Bradyrhizobium japonicum]MCP1819268.1 hypothetical protein [Bradyrhizobium japonicum]MCP1869222.1 hypothetical protein [Bradyrhizobium japonicum]